MLTIAMPLIILLFGCWLYTRLNVTTKHAPDTASAARETRFVFLITIGWIFRVLIAVLLLLEVKSSEPLSRWTVFRMIVYSLVLFYSLIASHLLEILHSISKIKEEQESQLQRIEILSQGKLAPLA
jgi:hypothetical protein